MLKQFPFGFPSEELETLFRPIQAMDGIGLAVSGGADSLGLMLLVKAWRDQIQNPPRICVYTVNHGLRPEALAECESVHGLALNFGFDCTILHWIGQKPATGIQAAARKARYVLMGQAMGAVDIGVLLTGHHAQDQAETVLMRLAHGSGVQGLAAMQSFSTVQDIEIFRPLLAIAQNRLEKIVSEAGIDAVVDPSNENRKYERIRWRKLLPQLDEMGLSSKTLSQFALRMGRANDALTEVSDQLFLNDATIDQFGMLKISQKTFLVQPTEIAMRLLSKMIFVASGERYTPELAQLEKLQVALSRSDFTGVVIGGCAVRIWRGNIVIFREVGRLDIEDIALQSGENIVWDQRFTIRYSGEGAVNILKASTLSRHELIASFDMEFDCPMAALHSVPLIKNALGEILAIGSVSLHKNLTLGLQTGLKLGSS